MSEADSLVQKSQRISDFLPQDVSFTDAVLEVPEWAFRPDHWSVAFLRGLTKLAQTLNGKRIWEIGVGTGVNLVVMRDRVKGATWCFSDFDERCVPLSIKNVANSGIDDSSYRPLYGSWDLMTPPAGRHAPAADVIIGCIPQVPANVDLRLSDNYAHYYCPERYPKSHLHPCGLGLVEALLDQARDRLKTDDRVILNLGGRPGIRRLEKMFIDSGFQPEIVHQELIPQHSGTSLKTLEQLEENGHEPFEFFRDEHQCQGIGATEAEALRVAGEPLFHRIYVIAGTYI